MTSHHVRVALCGGYSIAAEHVQGREHLLPNTLNPLLTPDQVAASLGISLSGFYKNVRPHLPVVMIDGKTTRFRLSDVVQYAADRTPADA